MSEISQNIFIPSFMPPCNYEVCLSKHLRLWVTILFSKAQIKLISGHGGDFVIKA